MLIWFSFRIRPHALPAGIVSLVLILRLYLFGNTVKQLVRLFLSHLLTFIFLHFHCLITSQIV